MNRRGVLKIFGITGVGLAAAAIGAKRYWDNFQAQRRTNLLIAGASPMISYIQRVAVAFTKAHKNIDIVSEKGHSSGALIALDRGGIDIAVIDRNLTQDEFNLTERSILAGIDGLGLIVHRESPIKDLSIVQAREIFEGLITNWKEVGGPDATINLYGREENSTTRSSIEDILMAGGMLSRRVKEFKSADELTQAVTQDIHGIGYISVRTMQDTTRSLTINGAALNEKNLLINLYPLIRPMFLVISGDGTPDIDKFVDFTLSAQGQKVLVSTGMLRVS